MEYEQLIDKAYKMLLAFTSIAEANQSDRDNESWIRAWWKANGRLRGNDENCSYVSRCTRKLYHYPR